MYINTPESKHIFGFLYDEAKQTLIVVFRRKYSKYIYYNVPEELANEFKSSLSKSRFFLMNIKGKFMYTKLS